MNTDLIQSITQQAAVIIVNTIFFSTVIRPRRLSVPMTAFVAAAGFLLPALLQIFLSSFFTAGSASGLGGIIFHIIYWLISIAAQFLLFFVLAKRDWLHNILLYIMWDVLITLLLGAMLAALRPLIVRSPYSGDMTALLCTIGSAILTAFLLRSRYIKRMRLPAYFSAAAAVIYILVRLANTILFFRIESSSLRRLTVFVAVFAAVFLLASVVCAYIAIDICIKRKCQTLEFKYKVRNKRKGNSINQLITALNSLCAENNIHIYSESLHSLPDNKTDGRILCIIQLVFYILLDYAIKAGRQPLHLLFFIKQEENDFVIISVSLIGSAISRRRNKTASLQCSLHEILLNHLVRICHGRVQYLDSQASAKNIRIIVPVSQYFDTGA